MFKHSLHRSAFTMIELIFAIVIIAVSVMSLPMMTQVTSSAIEGNLVQEAIFASVAEINMATTYVWDENSLIDDNESSTVDNDLSSVLNLTANCNGTGIFIGIVEILRKPGHINRRCIDNPLTARYANFDFIDSLEAAQHAFSPIYIGTEAAGYKKEYDSQLVVTNCDTGNCVDFGLDANNTDLKEITVTIREKDDATNKTITLIRTYSANIGEVAYANKVLP
ncbi:MAG: prepilin-type N-terminal cleavage/methylation domain-containing protein [Sulfurimonas sp.]|jgi:prepilin-type N-terminal cleavage/methylation domain-containing protein|nr:prepilin-type N-terminal cleavage/methylation domain-containing protein [Sulfurimonas sp.]